MRNRYFIQIIVSFIAGFTIGSIYQKLSSKNPGTLNANNLQINDLNNAGNYFLICIIFTSIDNVERRQTIRQTWLNLGKNLEFKHYFVIGTQNISSKILDDIQSEQKLNNDLLLLENLTDNYGNLTLKLLQSLIWIDHNVQNFEYLLKVDDDSFARIDKIFDYLKNRRNSKLLSLYWGFFNGNARMKQNGPWKESNWFLCDHYLPYALGGGYVLSQNLVNFVSRNSNQLQLYQNEDVTLGLWLSPLNIERLHDKNFDTEYKSRGCINTFLIQHKQSISNMKIKYNSLIKDGQLCAASNQYERFRTYEYNWNELPSKCCIRNVSML